MPVRLQKIMAEQGICSRRKAEELIRDGCVMLNGKPAKLGDKADISTDKIEVKGKMLNAKKNDEKIYIMMNKPVGYITSSSSKQGDSVLDLLKPENAVGKQESISKRIFSVGRLDKDSEGLVLLTNDGDLTNRLTHPRYEHEKEYEILIDKPLSDIDKKAIETKMNIGIGDVRGIRVLKQEKRGKNYCIKLILKEGKNRQIRKMFGRRGYNLISLKRTRIGMLKLGGLKPGKWKLININNII